MQALRLLEETGSGSGSIWVPLLVLGWFVIMTLVGWQVSHRSPTVTESPQDTHDSHSENPPSEFDDH